VVEIELPTDKENNMAEPDEAKSQSNEDTLEPEPLAEDVPPIPQSEEIEVEEEKKESPTKVIE